MSKPGVIKAMNSTGIVPVLAQVYCHIMGVAPVAEIERGWKAMLARARPEGTVRFTIDWAGDINLSVYIEHGEATAYALGSPKWQHHALWALIETMYD